jgi:hypothetical protein
VKLIVRLAALTLVALLAVIFIGPMFPETSLVGDWSRAMREVFNAWWGFPLGLPG